MRPCKRRVGFTNLRESARPIKPCDTCMNSRRGADTWPVEPSRQSRVGSANVHQDRRDDGHVRSSSWHSADRMPARDQGCGRGPARLGPVRLRPVRRSVAFPGLAEPDASRLQGRRPTAAAAVALALRSVRAARSRSCRRLVGEILQAGRITGHVGTGGASRGTPRRLQRPSKGTLVISLAADA